MLHETVLVFGVYLVACGVAWVLHESAHYAVHSLYAKSVSFGLNRRGPYVDAVYEPSAPTLAIRVGSVAPTIRIYHSDTAAVLHSTLQDATLFPLLWDGGRQQALPRLGETTSPNRQY